MMMMVFLCFCIGGVSCVRVVGTYVDGAFDFHFPRLVFGCVRLLCVRRAARLPYHSLRRTKNDGNWARADTKNSLLGYHFLNASLEPVSL
jgi:hypothetical protein